MSKRKMLAVVAAGLMLFTACGGESNGEETAEASQDGALETTDITYGIFSSGVTSRTVIAAENLGYFDDVGLNVELLNAGNSPAEIVPMMVSGDVDLAYLGHEIGMNAAGGAADVVALRDMQGHVEGGQQLWAAPGSNIESIADLKGATVGVIGVGGYGDLMIGEALKTEGLSLDDISLVEVPAPATISTLAQGDVDAAWITGPFAAALQLPDAPPVELIVDFYDVDSIRETIVGGLWSMRDWVEENPNTASAFIEAMERAAEDLANDEELDREQLSLMLPETGDEIIAHHPLYPYIGAIDASALEGQMDLMVEHGILDEPVEVTDVIYEID